MNELLSTAEAADRLGVTVRAVQKMIEAGTLTASKVGRDYIIQASDIKNLERRPPGRPPKAKPEALSRWEDEGGTPRATKKRGKS